MDQRVNREARYYILCKKLTRDFADPVRRESCNALGYANGASQSRFEISLCFRVY